MTRLLRKLAIAAAVGIAALVGAVLVVQRVSDGPTGPISGGPLRSGELVTGVVDWAAVDPREIELQLVQPPSSRTTGSIVHEGELYVPCDLGFIWRRLPSGGQRAIASVLFAVKHWHEDALRDGRVVLRIAGRRYERQAVRVSDPALLATLRAIMEEKASRYMSAELTEAAADPDAIWFFRIDPRPGGAP